MALAAAERADLIDARGRASRAELPSRIARGVLRAHQIQAAEARQRKASKTSAPMRGAVLRSGEAVRKAPILQRIRGRAMARLDIGENFDRRGDPCTRRHAPVG